MLRKLKVIIISTMLVVFLFYSYNLAKEKEKKIVRGGAGYFSLGGSIIDIDALNSRLENKGYPKFSKNFFSLGGGGYGIIGNIIIGGEGHGLIEKETSSNSCGVSFACGYGFFDIGYIIYSTEKLFLYPFLGIGGGGMSLKIIEKESPDFDKLLESPEGNAELSSGGFLIHLSLGADYSLKQYKCKRGKSRLIFGIRAGYIFTPFKGDWEMNDFKVSNAPKMGITGPYVRLLVGFGGIVSVKD